MTSTSQLGRVSRIAFAYPKHDGGEDESSSVVHGGLVVSGGQAPPLLEPVEAALDGVALSVGVGGEARRAIWSLRSGHVNAVPRRRRPAREDGCE